MLSEKLFISPSRVTVDYEMRNDGKTPVDITVGFPLPKLNAAELVNEPVITDADQPENFVHFAVTVDGKTIEPKQEVKAVELEGAKRDVTDMLRSNGALMPPVARGFYNMLETLPESARKKLEAEKLLVVDRFEDGSTTFTPTWETQLTYVWTQHYAPGAVVRVHHEYVPVVGRGFFGEFAFGEDSKPWCIDEATKKGILALLRAQKPKNDSELLERKQIDYVLTTGANWAGPIRSFELVLEKESPGQIVTTCFSGLKKTSPTQFLFSTKDFTPSSDLSVLFIAPLE